MNQPSPHGTHDLVPSTRSTPATASVPASAPSPLMPSDMKHRRGVNLFRPLCIASTVLWLGLFALIPHVGLFAVTFLSQGEQEFVSPVLTLSNYAQLLEPSFLRILGDSLWLAFASTLVCLAVGYPFAYQMAVASPRLKPWLLLLVIIPFWTNSIIRTYALIMLLQSGGIISSVLQWAGIVHRPVSFLYQPVAVFLGITYTFLPFMILPLYASIERMDNRLLDAAADLGAGPLRAFWHITLPLTLPGIVAGSMLVFLPSLGAFYIPEILGGSKTMLVGTFIKNQFLVARNWPLGAASSTLLTLMLGVLIGVYLLCRKRVATSDETDLLDEHAA